MTYIPPQHPDGQMCVFSIVKLGDEKRQRSHFAWFAHVVMATQVVC